MSHRLFLALELPADIRSLVGDLVSKDQLQTLPVKWEPLDKLHLTLNFAGRVSDQTATLLRRRLEKIIPSIPAFQLRLLFLECLYRRHGDSLIYLAPAGDLDSLKDLQHRLAQLLATELQIPQPHRFLPHVLIGHPQKSDPPTIKRLLDQITAVDFTPTPYFPITGITLFESHLSRSGSFHQKIGHFALK